MATTSIVRLNDNDIERLAAALVERVGLPLEEIVARLTAIETLLAEKKAGRKKAAGNEATNSELH